VSIAYGLFWVIVFGVREVPVQPLPILGVQVALSLLFFALLAKLPAMFGSPFLSIQSFLIFLDQYCKY